MAVIARLQLLSVAEASHKKTKSLLLHVPPAKCDSQRVNVNPAAMESNEYNVTPTESHLHNVKLSDSQIASIAQLIFPNARLSEIRQLERGRSFNNRLYFLALEHQARYLATDNEAHPAEAVLKLSGKGFDARKVQNEVSCLLLMQKHCPNVPAPRVIAWSEDGIHVYVIDPEMGGCTVSKLPLGVDGQDKSSHGWIIQTKLPGRLPTDADMNGHNSDSLAQQIAMIMANWRQNMPSQKYFGNFKLQYASTLGSETKFCLETMVSGQLLCETQPEQPIRSDVGYYAHQLAENLHKLRTKKVFSSFPPDLLSRLERFIDMILPKLPCFNLVANNRAEKLCTAVFAHADFAPRNFLISVQDPIDRASNEGAVRVTGVVDFEFAGFLPANSDFMMAAHDWPPEFWNKLLHCLESLDLSTPSPDLDTDLSKKLAEKNVSYTQEGVLFKLIDHVAPWWLEAGMDEIGVDLETSISIVKKSLDELEGSVVGGK